MLERLFGGGSKTEKTEEEAKEKQKVQEELKNTKDTIILQQAQKFIKDNNLTLTYVKTEEIAEEMKKQLEQKTPSIRSLEYRTGQLLPKIVSKEQIQNFNKQLGGLGIKDLRGFGGKPAELYSVAEEIKKDLPKIQAEIEKETEKKRLEEKEAEEKVEKEKKELKKDVEKGKNKKSESKTTEPKKTESEPKEESKEEQKEKKEKNEKPKEEPKEEAAAQEKEE